MSRAIGYVRVSTEAQAESGLGLEAQRAALQALAGRLGLSLTATCCDAALSGSLALQDRPGLLEAVSGLRRGDTLIVAKRDRLGRDVIAVAMIERLVAKKGARIVSAAGEGTEADGPTGLLMRRMIDAFAEYERLVIGARTKAALKAKRARGERFSGIVPFGYRLAEDGRTLEPAPAEQPALEAIQRLRRASLSLQAIADELNAQRVSTRAGSPWRFEYVRNVLRRSVPMSGALMPSIRLDTTGRL